MFNISPRKFSALTAVYLSAIFTPQALANDGQTLLIENFVGTVNMITGDAFSVSGDTGNISALQDSGLIINGNETIENSSCKKLNGNIDISFGKKRWFKRIGGYKNLGEYPKLEITVPSHAHLEIRDSIIFGSGADFGSVDAKIKSCGQLTLGDIAGPLVLKVSGSGDFTAGDVGDSKIRISGSGDVRLNNMKSAAIDLSGSGDLIASDISGPAEITAKGSGDIHLGDIAGPLKYAGQGSSDFSAQSINESAEITLSGSSNIDIKDGTLRDLRISSSGSSEIEFGGKTDTVYVRAKGSSEIDIKMAKNAADVKTSGSAEVEINGETYVKGRPYSE